jgi:hypothetical protein
LTVARVEFEGTFKAIEACKREMCSPMAAPRRLNADLTVLVLEHFAAGRPQRGERREGDHVAHVVVGIDDRRKQPRC